MKIIIADSTIKLVGRNLSYYPVAVLPSNGFFVENVLTGFIDWKVKGTDTSITIKFNDMPSSAIGNSINIKAVMVQEMQLSVHYPVKNLGSVTITEATCEKTLTLNGLDDDKIYWILIEGETYLPYNSNVGYPYKANGGQYFSNTNTMTPSDPGASGPGSYGAFLPAGIQIKINI